MHCHLIISRKDQANKKKLSPLTNHKNTKNGVIKGGFARVNLFQQAEQGFDKLFGYDRQQSESFDYHNTMKNGSISEQTKLQEQDIQSSDRKAGINQGSNQENLLSINLVNKRINNQASSIDTHIVIKQKDNAYSTSSFNQETNQIFGSFISSAAQDIRSSSNHEDQTLKSKKKKKKERINKL